ncbi:MAG: DNA-protecting protein DprA [Betaproteobacteria bacterium]|nr:DNA-protecting protein DprA [Betaproteobacteria bacterium]
MHPRDELAPWIDLGLVPGLGSRAERELLSAFGLPQNVLGATRAQLARVVGEGLAAAIAAGGRGEAVELALRWLERPGNSVITLADDDYPKQLLEISDPPALIYVRGERRRLAAPSLAVVGSRNASPQGLANAEAFARALSDAGFAIASGGALGVDAAAHRGGLAGPASSIAVLGCGADIVYPRRNQPLFEELAAKGAIASEFPLGTPPAARNFPRRNRLIAGLARGCLVIEAALASGSLITARLAAEQGREVFAIPGSIHSPLSRGCHALIRQGAKLVESAQDILEELGMGQRMITDHKVLGKSDGLLQYMGYEPCSIDVLVRRAGLSAEAVSALLLQLELEGRVGSLPGGLYQRLA